jgi:hypothetical protein
LQQPCIGATLPQGTMVQCTIVFGTVLNHALHRSLQLDEQGSCCNAAPFTLLCNQGIDKRQFCLMLLCCLCEKRVLKAVYRQCVCSIGGFKSQC